MRSKIASEAAWASLLGRLLHPLELERLAELDRDLRELEALPVAGALGAGDRGGHHGGARLERQPADAVAWLAELARARAAGLGVHHHDVAACEHRVGGLERLLVVVAAPHREDAAVVVDRPASAT